MTQKSLVVPTTTRPAQTPKRPLTEFEKAAAKVQDGNKATPALTINDGALYSRPVVLERELEQHRSKSFEVFGEQADAKNKLFQKHGMDMVKETGQETAAKLLRHFIAAEVSETRRTGEKPDADARAKTLRENSEESRRRLQQTYGADRAPDILTRVRKFIRNHGAVSRVLAKHELAEHPEVISELADLVYRTNYR